MAINPVLIAVHCRPRKNSETYTCEARSRQEGERVMKGRGGPAVVPTSRLQQNACRANLQNDRHDDGAVGHVDNDDDDDHNDDDADVLVPGLLSLQTLSDGSPGTDGLGVSC